MLACITACVWLESAALPVQAEHYAVLYITFTGRCTHPQPTYVLARILLSSRALLAGITLLQLPCSTVLCLVRPCSCRVYKQDEPQTPPPVFYLQPYWKLELEEPNHNRFWGTQCCENNKMMPRLPRSTSSDRQKRSRHLEQVIFSVTTC